MKYNQTNLMPYALSVGERMANEYIQHGDYYPEEAWGSEGQIYPSLMGMGLLSLYQKTKKNIFLEGVKAIVASNVKKQLSNGGWALDLGKTANGIKFKVTPELMQITSSTADLPPTVTAIRLMAEYRNLTEDNTYDKYLEKGYTFLIKFWNEKEGLFDEMISEKILKLRANPRNYLIYSYLSILSISKLYTDAKKYIDPLYNALKVTFEAMHKYTYTLLYAEYAALIVMTERDSNYVKNEVKQRIENELVLNSQFIISKVPGAFGHVDGLRGICLEEGHLRNSVGAAIALLFYDYYLEKNTFTNLPFYEQLSEWILSMYGDSRFYEYIDINSGKKYGLGTPAQFLPLFWILREF